MKKFLKLITFIMIAIFTVSAVACNGTDGNESGAEPQAVITPTDNYLVKDGKSDYVVVYPETTSTPHIETAISELLYFFEEATGVKLQTKSDYDFSVAWSNSAKYISLGETYLLKASHAGDNIDRQELKITGYAITNKGDSVFLIGGNENGVINAVYRFLKEQFNFECYSADEIVLDKNVTDEYLLNYENVKAVPDIAFHASASGPTSLNQTFSRRIGMVQQSDWLIELGGQFYHNWLLTIPVETYAASHSNWFSPNQQQLCLTRDKEGLAQEVLKKIIEVLETNPTGYAVGFTQMDDMGWCDCSSCLAHANKYGAKSASQIEFMNYLWDILEDWLNVNMPGREVYLYMFAYQENTEPPKVGADGKLPEEMILNEHIYVQYAPIYAAGYQSYDYKNPNGSDNSVYDANIQGWRKVTNNIMFWSYSMYYKGNNGIYPYFDLSDMRETFRYMCNNGVDYLFDENRISIKNLSGWENLYIYIRSKLAWDVETDLTYATDAFFANYFKAASTTMRQLFDEYSTHYSWLIHTYQLRGQGGVIDILDQNYWSKGLFDRWMRLLDQAYEDIEYIKDTDPELHAQIYDRIRLESIALRYLCMSLYDNYCIYVGDGNTIDDDLDYFGINFDKLLD